MKHHPQRGVTLLELMIALTCVAILVGLSVPTYREFTRNNRVTAANNDLVTALNLARSEALRRARPVAVCASTDGESCATENDWDAGFIVFTDGGAIGEPDGDDVVLQQWGSSGTDVTLTVDQALVRYMPTGEITGDFDASVEPHGGACKGDKRRHVQINGTGAITTQLTACL